jgi:hypothetical protein
MNLIDCTTSVKKLIPVIFFTTITSISLLIDVPVEAQLNPRPSIFKEYPYSRAQKRKVRHRSNHRPKAKPNIKPKKRGAALNNRKQPFTRIQKKSPSEPLTIEFRAPGYPASR